MLDELIVGGELQESSKKSVLRVVLQGDGVEEAEQGEEVRFLHLRQGLARIGSRSG